MPVPTAQIIKLPLTAVNTLQPIVRHRVPDTRYKLAPRGITRGPTGLSSTLHVLPPNDPMLHVIVRW
jgi:hypothetical protein